MGDIVAGPAGGLGGFGMSCLIGSGLGEDESIISKASVEGNEGLCRVSTASFDLRGGVFGSSLPTSLEAGFDLSGIIAD